METKKLAETLRTILPECDFWIDEETSELIVLTKLVWKSEVLEPLPKLDNIEAAVREGYNRMVLMLPTPEHLVPRPYSPEEDEDWGL